MKQLKFLKTISFEGKPIWYKDCIYEVISEGKNKEGRGMYKLFCEDFQTRGIDDMLNGLFYKVIEIDETETLNNDENKKDNFKSQNKNNDILSKKETKDIKKPIKVNKKKKNNKN